MSDEYSPQPPRRSNWLAVLALILASAALVWQGSVWFAQRSHQRDEAALATSLKALNERIELIVRNHQAAERRVRDLEGVQKSLREEVLGVGQRASMVESAVAGLAGRQMDSSAALVLNETDFLLRLGLERLRLFGDSEKAATAFDLAETQLAALDNPQLMGVRQTIRAEAKMLHDIPTAPLLSICDRLDLARGRVAELQVPARAPGVVPPSATPERWYDRALRVASDLVRVRKIEGDERGLVGPLHQSAARAAITLDLLLAKSALLERDRSKAESAFSRIEQTLRDGFDLEQASAKDILAVVRDGRALPPMETMPEIGRALEELEHLRTTVKLANAERGTQ